MVRRDAFEAVGGFDEDFFMYAEDTDLFARIIDAGYKIAWVSRAHVTHPFPDESRAASSRREIEKVRSSTRYMRKHYGNVAAAIHRIAMATDALSRLVILTLPGLSGVLRNHGRSNASLRRRYTSRLRYVVFPVAGVGLFESAEEWNRTNPVGHSSISSN